MGKYKLLNKTGWLKRPLFCLLLTYPLITMADETPIEGVKETVELEVAQQKKVEMRTVVGTIVDNSDNTPVIGANVRIKDEKIGVISDVDGHFSIQIPRGKHVTLEISYIGYATQTVYITDQGEVNIKLVSDDKILEEVVIVGAGTQKKVSVTGAITSIKGTVLNAPSSSLTNNIAGKLAGVISKTTSGEPGSASDFYIRGIGTFGGRATPLILLDGVEISKEDLNRIPAESIESFSLLKDASATAIYGARGANGVMMVTTKEGELNQKARISVSAEASMQKSMKFVEYVDGAQWMEIYNEAAMARDKNPRYTVDEIDFTRSGKYPYRYPSVDWQDVMFKNSTWNERANINISGGGSKVTYYMSLQASHDTGMLDIPKTYSFDNNISQWTYVFQNNINYTLTPTTKISLKMNTQIGHQKGPGNSVSSLFDAAWKVNPTAFPATYPAREGDTHIRFGNDILSGWELYTNPYALMLSKLTETNYNTLNTVMDIEQKLDFITKGLKVTALVNFKNWSSSSFDRWMDPYYYRMNKSTWDPNSPDTYEMERLGESGTDYINEQDKGYSSDNTFYFDARLDYNRAFGNHNVSGMLMYMQREFRNGVRPNRLQGFSGRFTYDYKHKYLAEFNFGYNGTERLAKDDRFEFFPAMSLGWVPSSEDFWEPLQKYINHFKIRGSYGIVGSDGLDEGAGHYLYVDNVALSGNTFHTGYHGEYAYSGPVFNTFAVEDACWERVNKLDIGVDLELFNQLSITFDYFYDRRHKILMKRGSWPILTGYANTTPWSNIGKVDNQGVEFSVNWRKELVKDLVMDLRGNFTYNKNKYVYYDDPNYSSVWHKKNNQPLSISWGYLAEGYFQSDEEVAQWADQTGLGSQPRAGDIKYRDVNGDGIISNDDKVMLSPYGTTPRIQYGFGLNLTYKKFDFGVFFNGSAKRNIMIHESFTDFGQYNSNVMKWIADDHWTKDNQNAQFPRLGLSWSDIGNNAQESSHWMRNGNFIRFKTLEVGYRFPHCRVYFSGDNLAVWSPFDLWDPELSWNSYPLQRTFNIGVQMNF